MAASRLLLFGVGLLLPSALSLSTTELHGSGTTNPSKLIWKGMAILEEQSAAPIRMTYRGIGSSGGVAEFADGVNDFGSGDIPLPQATYDELIAAGKKPMHIPFVIGGVSFFHSAPGMDKLKLSGCILADIYQGTITTWDHQSIKDLNPGFSPPTGQKIMAARRALGSSSTAAMSQYLSAVVADCPSTSWTIGTGSGGDGKAPFWPSSLEVKQGSDGMANFLDETAWAIAYVDSGHGVPLGLKEVSISLKDGTYMTSSEADLAGPANQITLPAPTASWADVSLIYKPGAGSWPMVAFSYFYVMQDQTAAKEKGALTKAFMEFMTGTQGQSHLPQFGFTPLSTSAMAVSTGGVASITLDSTITPWTFETSTAYITGAGEYVFSSKRRTYEEYQLGVHDGNIEDMQKKLTAMEMQLKTLQEDMAKLGGSSCSAGGGNAVSGINVNFYNGAVTQPAQ